MADQQSTQKQDRSSDNKKKLKRNESTLRIPVVPSVIDFEDTSDEVQLVGALESIPIASDTKEIEKQKEQIHIKSEFKTEVFTPHFVPSAREPIIPITNSKMSVGHTATNLEDLYEDLALLFQKGPKIHPYLKHLMPAKLLSTMQWIKSMFLRIRSYYSLTI